jgi:cytochrome c oxidase subunit 3
MSAEQLLVILGFVVIGVLFAGTLVGYVLTRLQATFWRPPGTAGLPPGLVASTAMLAGVSVCAQRALNSIRDNLQDSFKRSLWLTLAFAFAFLVGQSINWGHMLRIQATYPRPTLFAFSFYLLTGLHAAHVLGGFVPLGIVIQRALAREYSSSRHDGVKFCTWYWHYLGIIWLVLLSVMLASQ